MARNVFGGDSDPNSESPEVQKHDAGAPRRRTPYAARGATSQKYIGPSTKGQAARTFQKVQLDQISWSKVRDRLSVEDDIDQLVESIRQDGQETPITVRIVNGERPYEIVVGRRRLAAMRRLAAAGELEENTIDAFVRKIDDKKAIVSQWNENNQRLNPSFIERALFLAEIEKAGFEPKQIQESIGIDESLIRKMRAIVAGIPEPLLTAIGPAPEAGRPQWTNLRDLCKTIGEKKAVSLADEIDSSLQSKDRLAQAIALAKPGASEKTPAKRPVSVVEGHIAKKRSSRNLTFRAITKDDDEFLSYLEGKAPELYKEWKGE